MAFGQYNFIIMFSAKSKYSQATAIYYICEAKFVQVKKCIPLLLLVLEDAESVPA